MGNKEEDWEDDHLDAAPVLPHKGSPKFLQFMALSLFPTHCSRLNVAFRQPSPSPGNCVLPVRQLPACPVCHFLDFPARSAPEREISRLRALSESVQVHLPANGGRQPKIIHLAGRASSGVPPLPCLPLEIISKAVERRDR